MRPRHPRSAPPSPRPRPADSARRPPPRPVKRVRLEVPLPSVAARFGSGGRAGPILRWRSRRGASPVGPSTRQGYRDRPVPGRRVSRVGETVRGEGESGSTAAIERRPGRFDRLLPAAGRTRLGSLPSGLRTPRYVDAPGNDRTPIEHGRSSRRVVGRRIGPHGLLDRGSSSRSILRSGHRWCPGFPVRLRWPRRLGGTTGRQASIRRVRLTGPVLMSAVPRAEH